MSDQRLRKLGHDLWKIWNRDELHDLRVAASHYAIECCEEARRSGKYENGFPDRSDKEFYEQIRLLSELHSVESDFALRYPNEVPTLIALPDPLLCVLRKLIDYLGRQT